MENWYLCTESLDYIVKLIKKLKIESVLEVGLGHGYSANHFAKYCKRVVSIEKRRDMIRVAKENLAENVEIIKGDAIKVLDTLTEKFDLVFLDSASSEYGEYLKRALKLAKKVIIADNTISHAENMKDFFEIAKSKNAKFLEIGKGLTVIEL